MRVARCERAPELGPRILFFSGGSALRPLSRAIKHYTHNSIHLITPFDSGGSSAEIRSAFNMLSIGDLRNRLVALADESTRGNPEIYRLFCYRMAKDKSQAELRQELSEMVTGIHPQVAEVPEPMRHIIRTHLRFFVEDAPESFDLAGANIGNLLLTGGYLAQERDIESTLFLFSKLLEVRGLVRPTADTEYHLAAELKDGSVVVGQHNLTGKETRPLEQGIRRLYLVDSLHDPKPVDAKVEDKVLRLIHHADLLIFPMGSFYTSVMANLLPRGVGQAIAAVNVPKVYIPNVGHDPEQLGMQVTDAVSALVDVVRRDAGPRVHLDHILNMVLYDSRSDAYENGLDPNSLRSQGVQVVDAPILTERGGRWIHDPKGLSEVLLSLC